MSDKKMGKYLVQSASKSTTKGGKGYLRLQLFEKGGKVWPAILWEDRDLEVGRVVDCLAEETEYNGTPQLTVHALRVLDEKASDEFLPRTKFSIEGLFRELLGFVDSVVDPNIKMLLAQATSDIRWKRAPAAKSMHHAFIGGLLQHVVEMCRLSDALVVLYPTLRRDLLIAGCVLHDVGKLWEYEYSTSFGFSTAGELVGHISIGYQHVSRLMDKLQTPEVRDDGSSSGVRLLIEHIILSHHGQKAFGSPVTPMFIEAAIFTKIDGIGADMGRMLGAIEAAAPTAEWVDLPGYTREKMYLGEVKK